MTNHDGPASQLVEACRSDGLWPVLVGSRTEANVLLATPILMEDFPSLAEHSAGDLFDGTEIDEILSLRIQTLTSEEKEQVRLSGRRARAILDRTEALGAEDLLAMHGARAISAEAAAAKSAHIGATVVLRPKASADALDLLLVGRRATVCGIEEDFSGTIYAVVTVDDDPGSDLGAQGEPGHRFFFTLDEIQLL
jgi:hypothetical protein